MSVVTAWAWDNYRRSTAISPISVVTALAWDNYRRSTAISHMSVVEILNLVSFMINLLECLVINVQ